MKIGFFHNEVESLLITWYERVYDMSTRRVHDGMKCFRGYTHAKCYAPNVRTDKILTLNEHMS